MENNLNKYGQELFDSSKESMKLYWNDGFDSTLRGYCFLCQQMDELEKKMNERIDSKEHAILSKSYKDLSGLAVKYASSLGLTAIGRLKFKNLTKPVEKKGFDLRPKVN